ncbi:unnamed protein product, partial [Rotaria socialis]
HTHSSSSSSSHSNALQSCTPGNYAQMLNGNDNTTHSSYANNTNHIAVPKHEPMEYETSNNTHHHHPHYPGNST